MKRNFIYQLIYQLLSLALPLLTTPYLARVLGPEALGTYSYANATSTFFGLFILLGVANYGNRVVPMVRDETDQLWQDFCAIYRIQLLACGLVLLTFLFFLEGRWQSLLPYFILHLLSIGLDISWLFFGLEEFRLTTLRSIVIRVLSTLAIFIFVKKAHHLQLYTLIVVLTFLSTSLSLWVYLPRIFGGKKRVPVPWSASLPHLKGMLLLFVPVLAISTYTTVSKLLLKNLSSAVDVGFYDSVTVMLNVPTAVVNALGTVTLPKSPTSWPRTEKKLPMLSFISLSCWP
ncbi:oligosaccharide flippase family protein [Streptococcus suis]|uniref:oligosaccharide flippase family protein n=1 Tax=Streptococcus suis TaxID=1307 RepID=UPI00240DF4F6|nr:oligosaccharide flippase family protein [Streptococcus suis]WFA75455.1 oligosaccharide flippase family protein [Streptococcus suis]